MVGAKVSITGGVEGGLGPSGDPGGVTGAGMRTGTGAAGGDESREDLGAKPPDNRRKFARSSGESSVSGRVRRLFFVV